MKQYRKHNMSHTSVAKNYHLKCFNISICKLKQELKFLLCSIGKLPSFKIFKETSFVMHYTSDKWGLWRHRYVWLRSKPMTDSHSQVLKFSWCHQYLRIKGQDWRLIPSQEEKGWQIPTEKIKPCHVKQMWQPCFCRDGQSHDDEIRFSRMFLNDFRQSQVKVCRLFVPCHILGGQCSLSIILKVNK